MNGPSVLLLTYDTVLSHWLLDNVEDHKNGVTEQTFPAKL